MEFAQHKKVLIALLALLAVVVLVVSRPEDPGSTPESAPLPESLFVESIEGVEGYPKDVQPRFPVAEFQADPRLQDIEAGVIYVEWIEENLPLLELSADVPLPLASLTKIMTAYTALSEVGAGATVTITPDAVSQPGDHGQVDGMTHTLESALVYALALSSNDVAYAIQESVSRQMTGELPVGRAVAINSFVRRMNDYAEELGLVQTYFVDAVGFDTSEQLSGSYGTAREVSRLMIEAHRRYPNSISAASVTSVVHGEERSFRNSNPLVDTEDLLFSKTGFTDLAGGNLAVLVNTVAGPVSIVVMRSSFEGRITEIELLIRIFEDWYRNYVAVDSVY